MSSSEFLLILLLLLMVLRLDYAAPNAVLNATMLVHRDRSRIHRPASEVPAGEYWNSSMSQGSGDLQEVDEHEGQGPQPIVRPDGYPPRQGQRQGAWTGGVLANVALQLQSISQKLVVLQTTVEHHLLRLNSIDNRLAKLEVQGDKREETSRIVAANAARDAQTQAYQRGQLDAALETLRHIEERSALQAQVLATIPSQLSTKEHAALGNLEQSVAIVGTQVREALVELREQHKVIARNLTRLVNITRQAQVGQQQLVTRNHLSSSMAEIRQRIQLVPAPLLQSKSLTSDGSPIPANCAEIQERAIGASKNLSGVFLVHPPSALNPFFAFCDLETRGGGWTVIQQRFEGAVDFYRDWQDYRHGFGNLGGEFWLGLEKIHSLTNTQVNELLVELEDFTPEKAYAHYSAFSVGPEVEGYPLSFLAGYEGDAGDSLMYHAGMKFSTRDVDNDEWPDGNCAESHLGAWWYKACDTCNLNGRYLNGELQEGHHESQGMYWYEWRGPNYSLKSSRLLVRPRRGAAFSGNFPSEPVTAKSLNRGQGARRGAAAGPPVPPTAKLAS